MITPTKLIAAAAVAALAGSLLLAGPFTTRESTPIEPGAAGAYEPGVITPVTGTMVVVRTTDTGELGTYAGGPSKLDVWWETEFDIDDPRLDGMAMSRHNRNIGTVTKIYGGSRMITIRLDNDGGSWAGTGRAYSDPATTAIHYQIHMVGEGGYEGLDAILALDTESPAMPFEVSGAIISGGLPEMPDPVPAE